MVSICDVYDALALKRSYKKDYPPEKIHELMMLEKGKIFEPQLLDKFFQFMGVWPVGTLVAMSDGRVGVVRATNELDIDRPSVQVIAPENAGETVDLALRPDVRILESLNPQGEGAPVPAAHRRLRAAARRRGRGRGRGRGVGPRVRRRIMCGIIGCAGVRDTVPDLIEGLRRLEYRGYDSAGIAVAQRRRDRPPAGQGQDP